MATFQKQIITKQFETSALDDQEKIELHDRSLYHVRFENILMMIASTIGLLLLLRFVLALLAANPINAFAHFIYSVSQPLVAPFQGLFGVDRSFTGGSRFEIETIVAIIVYYFIAWLIASAGRLSVPEQSSNQ